jgi:hypothetical protein
MLAAHRARPAEQSVDRQRGAPAGRGEGLRTPSTPCRPCYGPVPKASHSPCTPGEPSTSTFRGWWGWAGGGGGGRGWARGVKPRQPCPNPIFPTARGSLPRPARTSEIAPSTTSGTGPAVPGHSRYIGYVYVGSLGWPWVEGSAILSR